MSELQINSNNIDLYNEAVKRIKNDNVLDYDEIIELEGLSNNTIDEDNLIDALYKEANVVRVALKGESDSNFTLDIINDDLDPSLSSKNVIENFEYLKSQGININTDTFNESLEIAMAVPAVNKEFLQKISPIVDLLKSQDTDKNKVLQTIMILSQLQNTDFDKFIESNGENAQEVVNTFSFIFNSINNNTFNDLTSLISNSNSRDKNDLLASIQAYGVVASSLSKEMGIPEDMKDGLKETLKLLVEGKVSVDTDREDVTKGISYYVFNNSHSDSNKVLQNSDFNIDDKLQRALLLHEIYHSYQDSKATPEVTKDAEADAYLLQYLYTIDGANDDVIQETIGNLDERIVRDKRKADIFQKDFERMDGVIDDESAILGYLRRSAGKANNTLQDNEFMREAVLYAQAVRTHGYNSSEAQNARQNMINEMRQLTKIDEDRNYIPIYPQIDQPSNFDGH